VIVARGWEATTDYAVGRAMEAAWLKLTGLGLAVQPMMSLPVLENMSHEAEQSASGGTRESCGPQVLELGCPLYEWLGLEPGERVAAMLRFGRAAPPSGRTGRLPVEDVLDVVEEGQHGVQEGRHGAEDGQHGVEGGAGGRGGR
jgi:hypothetical protein